MKYIFFNLYISDVMVIALHGEFRFQHFKRTALCHLCHRSFYGEGRHEKNLFTQVKNELRGVAEGHCKSCNAQDTTANCQALLLFSDYWGLGFQIKLSWQSFFTYLQRLELKIPYLQVQLRIPQVSKAIQDVQ